MEHPPLLDRTYSVSSRLIGHQVEVRLYAQKLEIVYSGRVLETLPRLHGERHARIDYRHIIHSLVTKPGAFTRYKYREELFPSLVFRRAYDALVAWRGERADVDYTRILSLAATTMEGPVERALEALLESGERFDYADVKDLASPEPVEVPKIELPEIDLSIYDGFLQAGAA